PRERRSDGFDTVLGASRHGRVPRPGQMRAAAVALRTREDSSSRVRRFDAIRPKSNTESSATLAGTETQRLRPSSVSETTIGSAAPMAMVIIAPYLYSTR